LIKRWTISPKPSRPHSPSDRSFEKELLRIA
jgi:hypothetical protein